ncbi:MAG TPA: hypothetical protein VFE62_18915 [Gemmataceae bacterium]|nr:hypothetical protein [Gemmataceae bacterium]
MSLVKLTDALTKNKGTKFSVPSVLTIPHHGASVTVSNVGSGPSEPVTFLNGSVDFHLDANVLLDLLDRDFILPTPPVSDKIPQRSRSGSTSEGPKKEGNTLSHLEDLKMKAAPLIKLRGQEGPVRRFKVLQQFEGKVTEVYEDQTFRADLIDLTDKTSEQESAEFPMEEIHPSDRDLIAPGAIFYWIMGYETTPSDYKRVSEIRLRRSPQWSEYEIDSITSEGKDLFSRFTRQENDTSSGK